MKKKTKLKQFLKCTEDHGINKIQMKVERNSVKNYSKIVRMSKIKFLSQSWRTRKKKKKKKK